MKIFSYQLSEYLNNNFSTLYLLSGSEPVVYLEVCDMIRAKFTSLGRVYRKVLYIEKEKSWCKQLLKVSTNLSLFAILKLIEIQFLRLPPNLQYIKNLYKLLKSNNIFLLIMIPHIDYKIQQTKWFKELEAISVFVPTLKIEDISGWIFNRAEKKHKISLNIDAISLLKQRYEGNLIALDKLISHYPKFLKAQDIFKTLPDNSRFNGIDLLDACILGDPLRCICIIQFLQLSDFDVSIILWYLISEFRILIFKTVGIKKINKKHKKALQRLSISSIHKMLLFAQYLDNAIKHKHEDNILWVFLNNLALMLAGALKPYE
ncbi:DNA polymerase III subunit delta [Candidatus Portiera aleyrodidarum]|uniref:DNA polymerase III subunit delta n=1 Tax=Candidatus Portiera aleyrodidarum TaxID=91844 RepID=UPI0005DA4688|nr:DNA polymerase III subunit delta [Candidatus Portiera aleyrodidarum]CEL12336.1 DNA polymerase III subunit delta [Candidatus Portiera aleyrodidarum]